VDALVRPHQGDGDDEAAQLVDSAQRLLQRGFRLDAAVIGMAEDGAADGLPPPVLTQISDPDEGMTIRRELQIGVLLEIHVVEETDGAPEILILAVATRHVAETCRNRLAVLAKAFACDPLLEEGSRLWRQRSLDVDGTFFRCGEFQPSSFRRG
jgi:hypothetical protein